MIKVKPGPLSTAKPEKGTVKTITLFEAELRIVNKVQKQNRLNSFAEAIRYMIHSH